MLAVALLSALVLASTPYTVEKKICSRSSKDYVVPRLNTDGLFQHDPNTLYYWPEVTQSAKFTTVLNQSKIDLYGLSSDASYINTFNQSNGSFKVFGVASGEKVAEFTFPVKCAQGKNGGALQLYGIDFASTDGPVYLAVVRYHNQLVLHQGRFGDTSANPIQTRVIEITPGSPVDLFGEYVAYQDACSGNVFLLSGISSAPVYVPLPATFGKLTKLFFAGSSDLVLADSKNRVIVVHFELNPLNGGLVFRIEFDRKISVPSGSYQLGWRENESKLAVLYFRTQGCHKTYYLDLYTPLQTISHANESHPAVETGISHHQFPALNTNESFWIKGVLDPAGTPVNIYALNKCPEVIQGTLYSSP